MSAPKAALAELLQAVPLHAIRESKFNPRRNFDAVDLLELRRSIRESGVLVPLIVRRVAGEGLIGYEVVAGARRYRAAKSEGLSSVPCIVRDLGDEAARETQIIENLQRQDVSPLEEAEGFRALLDLKERDVKQLAESVGKSKEHIYARLKLLEMDAGAKKALASGQLTPAHAVTVARLPQARQARAVKLAAGKGGAKVPVRKFELLVRAERLGGNRQRPAPPADPVRDLAVKVERVRRLLADAWWHLAVLRQATAEAIAAAQVLSKKGGIEKRVAVKKAKAGGKARLQSRAKRKPKSKKK